MFEYLYAGLPDQTPIPPPQNEEEGEWIALVSGLEMGNSTQVGDLRSELLVEWLSGELGGEEEDAQEAVKVSRLVLAGNSLARPDLTVDDTKKVSDSGPSSPSCLCI